MLQDVIRYSLTGPPNQLAFFIVHPDTGVITLIKSLEDQTINRFEFFVLASDQRRVNARTVQASVVVDVDSDQTPYFTSSTTIGQLQETALAGQLVHDLNAQDDDQDHVITCFVLQFCLIFYTQT